MLQCYANAQNSRTTVLKRRYYYGIYLAVLHCHFAIAELKGNESTQETVAQNILASCFTDYAGII